MNRFLLTYFTILFSIVLFYNSELSAQKLNYGISSFESSNLPLVFIDTGGEGIPDSPKIMAKMGIVWNGDGQRNYVSDPFNDYDGNIMIELRGASSQGFPKKQYALETVDSLGENNNVSLLGFPKENDWILHAPYSDKSLMRNVIEYQLARDLGWYASRTKYCELFLNGNYRGIYILMEKIKRDGDRVDISRLNPEDISGDQLTGGYIIKIDKMSGDNNAQWRSDYPTNRSWANRKFYQYHYPKPDEITQEQKNYIKEYISDFESLMESGNYNDPEDGYERFIDVNSFIDFMILNEISKNVDGYRLSTYIHKDRDSLGGKLKMGPVWDFNLAYGNADYYEGGMTSGWQYQMPGPEAMEIPFYWDRFMEDDRFTKKLSDRWFQLRDNLLSSDRLENMVDSTAAFLDEAQKRNFERWDVLGHYVWPNNFIGDTYNEEIDYLAGWILSRVKWIDRNIKIEYDTTVVADRGDYALMFDGKNDYVNCGTASEHAIEGNEITLEAWVNVIRFRERSYQGAIISRDQMGGGGNDKGYVLRCGGNGQVDFIFGDGSWQEIYSPQNAIEKQKWTHIAATYDGSKMKLYINGELVSTKFVATEILPASSQSLYIGNSPADISRGFDGVIDDVRIWNKARTIDEIRSTISFMLPESYYNSAESGLVGYWSFNEGESGITKDKSNQNHGILGLETKDDDNSPRWVLSAVAVGVDDKHKVDITEYKLKQNYPNPFNPETIIEYNIPSNANGKTSNVSLIIYDILGKQVAKLVDEKQDSGHYKVVFNASNLASGMYLYQLKSGNYTATKKMVLVK